MACGSSNDDGAQDCTLLMWGADQEPGFKLLLEPWTNVLAFIYDSSMGIFTWKLNTGLVYLFGF